MPATAPAVLGANVTYTVKLFDGPKNTAFEKPVTENPATFTVSDETMRLDLPGFATTIAAVRLEPTIMFPKLRAAGLKVSCACAVPEANRKRAVRKKKENRRPRGFPQNLSCFDWVRVFLKTA